MFFNCRSFNKLWCIYIVKYYSAIEINKLLIQAKTFMNLQEIMLRGKAIPNGYIAYNFYLYNILKWHNMRNRGKISDSQRYQLGLVVAGGRQRCGRDMNVLLYGQPKGSIWCSVSWLWWWIHEPTQRIKLDRTKSTYMHTHI